LADGEARFAALLTPQGRLLHDLFVVGRGEGAWLDVARDQRAALAQRLAMYRLRAKVELTPDETPVSALFPGRSDEDPGDGWVRDPRLAPLGWRGYGAKAPKGATSGTEADYRSHCLVLGAPGAEDWGVDAAYPIEANFDLLGGIDFQKGCYVGQETTSRMKRRGQVKTRMAPIVFDGPAPARGAEILAGALRAGEVLSGEEGRAIAKLRLDRIEGAQLTVDGRPVRVELPAWFNPA
jgi:tRNA-modifying protein YgfZ